MDSFKWPADASRKSVPACYLAGFALATSALSKGHSEAILDIGLAASTPGNRVYAALRGMADAGMEIPHSDTVLPSDERVNGEHIGENISKAVAATKKSIEGGK